MIHNLIWFLNGLCLGAGVASYIYARKFRELTHHFNIIAKANAAMTHPAFGPTDLFPDRNRAVAHGLVDDTLVIETNGVRATCECGWSSRGHFSGMAASAAFRQHLEDVTR